MDELVVQNSKQPQKIQSMFASIAGRYDLANTVLSLGIHHLWKRKVVRAAGVHPSHKILDCATGTGDLAFLFEKQLDASGSVIGTDFCESMLVQARKRAKTLQSSCQFQWADVTKLPFEDNQFDCATISFGIRNVQDPLKGLSELGRVVRPGGKVLILEFGQPKNPVLSWAYDFYSKGILPKVGGLISGQPSAYKYLQTSSAQFPSGDAFVSMARQSHRFQSYSYETLQGGIAFLYQLVVQ